MQHWQFTAIGTHWNIFIDHSGLTKNLKQKTLKLIDKFEQQYSRFLPNSEISLINSSSKKTHELSPQFQEMLKFSLKLNKLTHGYFSSNITNILEAYGYDKDYSFTKNSKKLQKKLGSFSLKNSTLTISGLVKLDLGGVGKGYLIDQIAKFFKKNKAKYFLIEAGGDIYATTKKGNQPWLAAIQHPLNQKEAIATIPLKNQALATSTSLLRRYKKFHHLLNPKSKKPVNNLLSVSVISPTAIVADALCTALFVTPKKYWPSINSAFNFSYLAIHPDLTFEHSDAFSDLLL